MKKISMLFLGVLLAFNSKAQNVPSKADSVDLYLQSIMQQRGIPGLQLAVIRQGKIIKLANYGLANIEHNVPVTSTTVFNINSITKAFTGVALMQLVEQGKLDLSAPVSRYLDSLPAAWQKVTVRQLCSHNSGIPDIFDKNENVRGDGSYASAMGVTMSLPMDFATGEEFRYNQTNYVLLANIINKLSGTPFTQFIKEKQLDIADMPLTRFGDSYDIIPNYAGAYTKFKYAEGKLIRTKELGINYHEFPLFTRAGAGMLSTAHEMAKWIIALQNNKLLTNKQSLSTLWQPSLLNNGKPAGFGIPLNGYAIGWPAIIRAEHPAMAPIGGGRSALFVYPKDDLAIVVLTNRMACNPESFIDELAGYFIPDMHASNGFGLSPSLKVLRAEFVKNNFNNAPEAVNKAKKKNPHLQLEENEINQWAYTLLNDKQIKAAITVFKLNTDLYPQSANTYDSLAEAYETDGQLSLAITNYKRSLALNPQNTNAAERIKALALTDGGKK